MPAPTFLEAFCNFPYYKTLIEEGNDIILIGDPLRFPSIDHPNPKQHPVILFIARKDTGKTGHIHSYELYETIPLWDSDDDEKELSEYEAAAKRRQPPVLDRAWTERIECKELSEIIPSTLPMHLYCASGKYETNRTIVLPTTPYTSVIYRLVKGDDGKLKAEIPNMAQDNNPKLMWGASFIIEIQRQGQPVGHVNLFL